MTTVTAGRLRTLVGFVLAVLGAFSTVRASPPEVITTVREWDSRYDHRLESLRVPTKSALGSNLPFAYLRAQPVSSSTDGFYDGYLARRVSTLFRDQRAVTPDFANPAARPWPEDPATVQRVQKLGLRAIRGALKSYAVERLGIDRWSFPVRGGSERSAVANVSPRVRFHLGFSHLAPRVDLRIPVTSGRVVVSADARGRIGTTFEAASSRLRVAAAMDVRERTATVALSARF